MSTSRHEGRILFTSSAFSGQSDQFCDAIYLRDGLANGLNHAADEWAQVRCNVMVPDLVLMTGTLTDAAAPVIVGTDDTGVWRLWFTRPLPVTVIDPGTPYLFRLWIAATSNDVAMDVELAVVLVDPDTPVQEVLVEQATDSVWISDPIVGGDPPGYAVGATLGAGAYANAIEMPATSSGPVEGVVAVFVRTTSDAGNVDLHALHLSEVVPV